MIDVGSDSAEDPGDVGWGLGMVRGLTDKESMNLIYREERDARQALARVKALAEKGQRDPHQLTPAETQELCGSVVQHIERLRR